MTPYNRHIKKDYQPKNLHNPFFRKKTSPQVGRLWRWLIAAGILAAGALVWFFLSAPFWIIQNVQLGGLTRISADSVEDIIWRQTKESRWLLFSESNIFLFDGEKAAEDLIAAYNLTDCTIQKKWPRTLEITGYERPYAFIWQEGSDLFYASGDGYIIKDQAVSDEDKQKYFILENKNPGTLIGHKNKINVNTDYLGFALDLNELIIANEELSLEKFIIDWEFNTLKAKFKDGPIVYFSTNDGAATQLERLVLVKKEKIKDNFSRTEYVDLRFGDRIFINPDFK